MSSVLSRYSYLWSFGKKQEQEYLEFVRLSNLNSLRLITVITLFGFTVFSLIDYFRDIEFSVVVLTRAFVLTMAAIILGTTYARQVNSRFIQWSIAVIAFINFGSAMVTATFARMPAYYLSNLLFLIFVLVVTASGLRFRHALLLNIICLVAFILFSQFVRRDPFYISQYPHAVAQLVYILIVGVVLEKRRRDNFLQFCDLTLQKKLVDDLNTQKSKIISILSHDLGSPLHSLSALVNLQVKGKLKEEEARPLIEKISHQLNGTSNLLSSLVRWSHSQMDGFVPDTKEVEISQLIKEVIDLYTLTARDKNVAIQIDHPRVTIKADEDMIRIVFRNLISNAIKFANGGTDVLIKGELNGKFVDVQITNVGASIPANAISKLFTYQMPSSEGTAGERGTGLGLAMTAYFIQVNGGSISYQPRDGSSNTFLVRLPINGNPNAFQQ